MRILHILRSVPFGGAQKMALELAREQVSSGHEIRILVTGRERAGAERLLEACEGFMVDFAPGHPLAQLRSARQVLADFAPEVVHLHLAPSWLAAVFGSKRDFALVAHLHTRPSLQIYPPNWKRRLHSALDRMLLSRCDALLAVSDWAAQAWRREHSGFDPVTVHNGVRMPVLEADALERSSGRPFTVGIALRLSERKGLDEFLEIAGAVHRRDPDIRFAVAGDGPLASHYHAKAEQMGLAKAVSFEGFVSEIGDFWRKVDLGAFTSSVDTFGLSMVEPVSYGRPVVAYRTGTGSDEVIDLCRGVTAVPYEEAEEAADAILRLRDEAELRARMATDGIADCQTHFSIQTMSRRVEDIYTQLLSRREAA
ncbi:glycosyltransferase family 4 protein [Aurantiacibacter sp. MUD61]|uniref:glycosyltransferase family 4 protein n=1 Tax=Aurantiacibacter sp. MUD61 TaxID=3009083 RepID=UPI0022F11BC9|nr:glycosyltransferase family 4 protein [Aurantiacibacter sp. MUD61]